MSTTTAPAKTAPADKTQNDLHAPLRPLGLKAVVAASMMLKRKTLKSAS